MMAAKKRSRRGRLTADVGEHLKRKLTAAAKRNGRTLTKELIRWMEIGSKGEKT